MDIVSGRVWLKTLAALAALALAAPASADQLRITVTSGQPDGGFAFSPVWVGLHDGTFISFTPGAAATPGIQAVAELADTSAISAEFAGHGPQATVGSAPIPPGGMASAVLDVADPATSRFLSFASMVVPSNDFFFGNADPTAFSLFDASGVYQGDRTIQIFGGSVWDAGSEVNDVDFGAAFIVGNDIHDRVAENGTIGLVFGGPIDQTAYLNSILGKATPGGYDISHLISPGDLIATIRITAVPEPSSIALCGIGAAGLLIVGRKARKSRSSDAPPQA